MLLCATSIGCATPGSGELPHEGVESWALLEIDELVTFVLFDPAELDLALPHGMSFLPARVAPMPFVRQYVAENPEAADLALSFVEITRQSTFRVDGEEAELPADGGVALWFAPVDASGLMASRAGDPLKVELEAAENCVVGLGIWTSDGPFVERLREHGHAAFQGSVTLRTDEHGSLRGSWHADDLVVEVEAAPLGEPAPDASGGSQVLLSTSEAPSRAIVFRSPGATHQSADAYWSVTGDHLLAAARWFGPTFRTTYPVGLTGRAYPVPASE